ncbi:TIGR03557 family F420-dependent LLM class oxidoreductase [Nocardioides sp. cx-173]|uniref:TIGR03557 family F420-dependent LLM class oxidoreductase n=1 Tax=Nocardioides sp. cx-173 TaxID=2898796 RepID=UPI001E60DBA2|nr:TIGR03557 family F420-dependent LLM class oxidoreductase [Nocardioides sp. cx-173]MCD4523803.1 TIGR03557 family F420-dependent LLM class oxidoreductase [Nocardioides sp. cx-173]UGB41875.1 TIGR03557 family F420-dependent LLM class oxidoreductase [Nocardioides sp. cx-173]
MTNFGYTLMTEQSGPRDLVSYAVGAEEVGFDFEVSSDHFSPWLTEQGHAPYAWSVLGAVAHATSRVGLMTYVTSPIQRYHPAVVAQKAATLGLLSEGRFTLGLGSGESLNEHVVGGGWPGIATRQERLVEAVEIIRELFTGELVDYRGNHFDVDSARIWDLPDTPVELALAVAGERAISTFAPLSDHLIAVEPDSSLVSTWNDVEGAPRIGGDGGARAIGQIPICWAPDAEEAKALAHEQFRWFGGGWKVNADLPTPMGFAGATQFVTPDDVAGSIPCGPDLDAIVEAVSAYWEAGFTDIALVQVGDRHQRAFLSDVAGPLLEKLRAAAP